MNKTAILFLSMLMLTQPACAASFDCAKASTKVEKMICADPELSKLDEDLSAGYSKALKESTDPTILKQQQRRWIKIRNKCQEETCIKASYRRRIDEMNVVPLHAADETYALVMSKNDEMCNYMRLLMGDDLHQFGRWYDSNDRFVGIQEVFQAVPWKPARASYKIAGRVNYSDVEGAVFDLNNDGVLDYVVRDKGMLSGMRLDGIYMFDRNTANRASNLTTKELFESDNQIQLDQVIYPLSKPLEDESANLWLLSPFVYQGISYLYMQSLYKRDEAIGGDLVVVAKYLGGKIERQMNGELEDICYIKRVDMRK